MFRKSTNPRAYIWYEDLKDYALAMKRFVDTKPVDFDKKMTKIDSNYFKRDDFNPDIQNEEEDDENIFRYNPADLQNFRN